jgi:hypothetical protein
MLVVANLAHQVMLIHFALSTCRFSQTGVIEYDFQKHKMLITIDHDFKNHGALQSDQALIIQMLESLDYSSSTNYFDLFYSCH